jgi:hypothetical protein
VCNNYISQSQTFRINSLKLEFTYAKSLWSQKLWCPKNPDEGAIYTPRKCTGRLGFTKSPQFLWLNFFENFVAFFRILLRFLRILRKSKFKNIYLKYGMVVSYFKYGRILSDLGELFYFYLIQILDLWDFHRRWNFTWDVGVLVKARGKSASMFEMFGVICPTATRQLMNWDLLWWHVLTDGRKMFF